ncbi:MAG: Spi family protease inhibitor, partial [Oscillospiraceae bacterium]|nr:Spi family protease inhibitor [Oscillospiraceae bacterium]
MNRIILAFFLLFAGVFKAFSNPVDMETAKMIAQNFMNISSQNSKTISDVVIEKFEGQNSFYVVNFHEGGWVMVSAEDKTMPVFAYSYSATYRIEDEKPDGFLFLTDEYKEGVDIARKEESARDNKITEMWNQLTTDEVSGSISRDSIRWDYGNYVP